MSETSPQIVSDDSYQNILEQLLTDVSTIRNSVVENAGRSCRILMDLAGHKIRTGAIELGHSSIGIDMEKATAGSIGMLLDSGCRFEQIRY